VVTATRMERLSALRYVIAGCGYGDREIAERFPIWLPGRDIIRADYVAFTNPDQRDMSTSAIVAQVVDGPDDIRSRWVPAAAALAAPAVLIALPDRIAAWTSGSDAVAAGEVASVPVTAPASMISRLRMLTPDAIARAKSQGFQRTLFPLDIELLNASRQRARSYLTEQVERALTELGSIDDPRADELIPKLVIGVLATLMIRDKTDYNYLANGSAGPLIDIAQQRFPGYFDWLSTLTSDQFDSFSSLVEALGSSINFAGLEPAMVSDVYEQALFTKLQRRQQGTYYTPPQLAEQIFNVIPIEHLEPDRRLILDPACGSGTMLLAGAKRLTQTQGERFDSDRWHGYLTNHLRGFDKDTFATEITKLCLLMTALPIGNHWDVDSLDSLDIHLPANERPSIMISNPPWKFERDPAGSIERANMFLSWMLDNLADDGFLACVVPLSWINRNNSQASRNSLLHGATLLEVWRLPSSLFHNTRPTTAPAVIVAQKVKGGHARGRVTLVKTVRDSSLPEFLSKGLADEAYLVEPGDRGQRLTFGPLNRAMSALTDFTSIGEIAAIHNGRPQRPRRLPRSPDDATHYELGSLRTLQAFRPIDPDLLTPVRYPEDYDSAKPSDERVRAHKVVVTAKNFGTRNPWRINVGYDQYGASLREMFHMVIPDQHWYPWSRLSEVERFSALMAVLGSGLVSSLIDENEPTRNISTRRIAAIPFPTNADSIRELASIGHQVSEAVATDDRDRIADAVQRLEATVSQIYRLPEDARAVIAKRLTGAPGFDGTIRYAASSHGSAAGSTEDRLSIDVPSFGRVLEAGEDGLLLWISGVTAVEGAQVPALPQIPGWLCESGSDFRVEGDLANLHTAHFGFHAFEYLTEDELTHPGLAQ
jgi:N-6 DNA Methylase